MTPSGTDEKTGPLAFCVASGLFLPARGMDPNPARVKEHTGRS